MQRLFVSTRTKAAAIVIAFVLPPLMLGFAYFHAHRPAVHVAGERTVWDYTKAIRVCISSRRWKCGRLTGSASRSWLIL